jgi:hypothetical protein
MVIVDSLDAPRVTSPNARLPETLMARVEAAADGVLVTGEGPVGESPPLQAARLRVRRVAAAARINMTDLLRAGDVRVAFTG